MFFMQAQYGEIFSLTQQNQSRHHSSVVELCMDISNEILQIIPWNEVQ